MDPAVIKEMIKIGLECYREVSPNLDEVKSILSKELSGSANTITDMVVETNVKSFNAYIKAGLTREEAITLLVSSNHALKKSLSKLGQNNPSSKKDS